MLGLTFLSIKIVSLHRQERGCSSELLRRSASDAGIEIKCFNVTCVALSKRHIVNWGGAYLRYSTVYTYGSRASNTCN